MKSVVTYGEILGRLSPDAPRRLSQSLPGPIDLTFAGAEANVAVSIALLGVNARFVTALPRHAIADACVAHLRGLGVDTSHIQRTDTGRMGLFFLESGANQRPSNVIYDRENAAVALTPAEAYAWDEIFDDAGWFHVSGVTPAISSIAAEAALTAMKAAQQAGLTVSLDLNYRTKLWRWDSDRAARDLAEQTLRGMLPYADLVMTNEYQARDILQIPMSGPTGELENHDPERPVQCARQIAEQFPNLSHVAITLREIVSANHNNVGAMLYEVANGGAHFSPRRDGRYRPYEIRSIVDRIGAGDAFAAGLIFALMQDELSAPEKAIGFAAAAFCLKHSIHGDFNLCGRAEIEALAAGRASGGVNR